MPNSSDLATALGTCYAPLHTRSEPNGCMRALFGFVSLPAGTWKSKAQQYIMKHELNEFLRLFVLIETIASFHIFSSASDQGHYAWE